MTSQKTLTEQVLASLPGTLDNLRRVDALWTALRSPNSSSSSNSNSSVPIVVREERSGTSETEPEWDVVISGGTLGIILATALVQQGWRVALLERGVLRGRQQEWNISRSEVRVLVELGLLTEGELERTIVTEYNPARVCFAGGEEVWVRDVLNLGVDPVYLLETLKRKFLLAGGQLFEHTPFVDAIVQANAVTVQTEGRSFTARLLLDAMGHFSPIVQQARQGQKPDAVCLVVGSCATGFPSNNAGDLIVSFTPLQNQCQYFWEAFPAQDGRTTYLFTYLDAHPDRPSLENLFEDYLRLLPRYQGVELDQLQFQRALFGLFPCYRQPLQPQWNRILFVGDSSGNQSPLSFGGFGAMMRHLRRLRDGIHEALVSDALDRAFLGLLQPYQPNLAVTWLFQRAMSAGMEQKISPTQINELLASVFHEMAALGEPVLKPFLQDVVQFPALGQTLLRTAIAHPNRVLKVIPQVGVPTLVDWLGHFLRLGSYAALYPVGKRLEPWIKTWSPTPRYYGQQWLQALQYGSGNDYEGKVERDR